MSKYLHWNADEIRSHIENFGTEDEKEILKKLSIEPEDYCDGCPNADTALVKLTNAVSLIDEVIGKFE